MNTKQLIAAVAVFAVTGSAFAESTKTRADVIAELEQARAQGLMQYPNRYPPTPIGVKYTRTREEVLNELIQAKKSHQIDTTYSGH